MCFQCEDLGICNFLYCKIIIMRVSEILTSTSNVNLSAAEESPTKVPFPPNWVTFNKNNSEQLFYQTTETPKR